MRLTSGLAEFQESFVDPPASNRRKKHNARSSSASARSLQPPSDSISSNAVRGAEDVFVDRA